MHRKKINLVLFSILLNMVLPVAMLAMNSKFFKNFKNIPKHTKFTPQQNFTANVKDSFQGFNNIPQDIDKVCLENIVSGDHFVNIFENVDGETVHNIFESIFKSFSSSSKELLHEWQEATKELRVQLINTPKSELGGANKEEVKTWIQKGIEFAKNHKVATGVVGTVAFGSLTYIAIKNYQDHSNSNDLKKIRKDFNEKSKQTIEKVQKITNQTETLVRNLQKITTDTQEIKKNHNSTNKSYKIIEQTIAQEAETVEQKVGKNNKMAKIYQTNVTTLEKNTKNYRSSTDTLLKNSDDMTKRSIFNQSDNSDMRDLNQGLKKLKKLLSN